MSDFIPNLQNELSYTLTISDDSLNKLIEFISVKLKNKEFSDLKYENLITLTTDHPLLIQRVYFFIHSLALSLADNNLDEYLSKFGNITDQQRIKIQYIVEHLKKYDLVNEIAFYEKRKVIETDILPSLERSSIISNYRFLDRPSGKMELIPLIQCALEVSYGNYDVDNEIFKFQFSPESFDKLVDDFIEFRNNFKKENEKLKNKLSEDKR